MLSIYQIKEGRDLLQELYNKSYTADTRYYTRSYAQDEYGVNFYNGYDNPVLFIPVMLPEGAKNISTSVISAVDQNSKAVTEASGVLIVTDNNFEVLLSDTLKQQYASCKTLADNSVIDGVVYVQLGSGITKVTVAFKLDDPHPVYVPKQYNAANNTLVTLNNGLEIPIEGDTSDKPYPAHFSFSFTATGFYAFVEP